MSLSNSYIERIRLLVGDTDVEWEYLEDPTYEYLYFDNAQNELLTAVAALENIINYVALNPESETLGQVNGKGMGIDALERRLTSLKIKAANNGADVGKVPIVLRSGRKNWDDFDSIFKW